MGNALGSVGSRKQKTKRKTLKQKGGFYPSVYGGVAGATILAPLVARQTLRMFNSTRKQRKSLRKKKRRNYTRSIA
jgi:hypothetical protein